MSLASESALYAAVCAAPHDDRLRLVYADALEETGAPVDVARAEFIRLQCERAAADLEGVDLPDYLAKEAQERALFAEFGRLWRDRTPDVISYESFERGFALPQAFYETPADAGAADPAALESAPLWRLTLAWPRAGGLGRIWRAKVLARATELTLAPREAWAASDFAPIPKKLLANLANVTELTFRRECGTERVADWLAALDLPRLRAVTPSGSLSGLWLAGLARSPCAARLTALDLRGAWGDTDSTIEAANVLRAGHFPRLRKLVGHWQGEAEDAVLGYLTSPAAASLREFRNQRVATPDFAAALLASPNLNNLRVLHLGGFPTWGYALRKRFAESPRLADIRELWLDPYRVAKASAGALMKRFGERLHPRREWRAALGRT